MWKTQHMAILGVCVAILSVTLTLYAESRFKNAIASKATELNSVGKQKKTNPIQLMGALQTQSKNTAPTEYADDPNPKPKEAPKGAGSRWTPL